MQPDDGKSTPRGPMDYVILVAPALLVGVTITDAVAQIVTTHTYVPHDWLLSILSSTIAACMAKYFQQDYVKKIEKQATDDKAEIKELKHESSPTQDTNEAPG
jgi:hypothetical protein